MSQALLLTSLNSCSFWNLLLAAAKNRELKKKKRWVYIAKQRKPYNSAGLFPALTESLLHKRLGLPTVRPEGWGNNGFWAINFSEQFPEVLLARLLQAGRSTATHWLLAPLWNVRTKRAFRGCCRLQPKPQRAATPVDHQSAIRTSNSPLMCMWPSVLSTA